MTFRLCAQTALVALAVLILSGCGDPVTNYSGPGLPAGYKKYEHDPNPVAEVTTSVGLIKIELYEDRVPDTVDNFVELCENHKYDNLPFHRIIKDFMVQGGDPQGNGMGGPGYTFDDEIYTATNKHEQYSVAMANRGKDQRTGQGTNGSQFFIVTDPKGRKMLDDRHTVFGKVIEGKDVVDKLNLTAVGTDGQTPTEKPKIISVKVVNKRPHDYKLAESKKHMDPSPRTFGPGKYTSEDFNKMMNQGGGVKVTPSTPPEIKTNPVVPAPVTPPPAKTPEPTKAPEPAKVSEPAKAPATPEPAKTEEPKK